jgi:hypothetical protein
MIYVLAATEEAFWDWCAEQEAPVSINATWVSGPEVLNGRMKPGDSWAAVFWPWEGRLERHPQSEEIAKAMHLFEFGETKE